jgi:hypothetical protein
MIDESFTLSLVQSCHARTARNEMFFIAYYSSSGALRRKLLVGAQVWPDAIMDADGFNHIEEETTATFVDLIESKMCNRGREDVAKFSPGSLPGRSF